MYKQAPNQTALFMAEKFIITDPGAAAYFLETLSIHEAVQILQNLKSEYAVSAVSNMCGERAALILRRMPVKQSSHIMSRLSPAHSAAVMALYPEHYRVKIKDALPKMYLKQMEHAVTYPKGSAGALMQGGFFTFKTDDKLKDIISFLKNLPKKKLPALIYITDRNGVFAGTVKTASLLFFQPDASAGSVMLLKETVLKPGDAGPGIKEIFKKDASAELPVINKEGVLLGVVYLNKLLEEKEDTGKTYKILTAVLSALLAAAVMWIVL